MAYTALFFESVAGDRLYTANQFASIFKSIQTQGYIPDYNNEMLVVESSPAAMTTRVSTGAGFVQGRYIEITSYHTITHAAAHATLHRKDLVILRLDLNTGVRDLFPTVLQGTNAATQGAAVAPTLTQNSTIWEVGLAEVYIAPTDTAISNSEITDRRESLWGRASYPDLTEHKALATLDHPDLSVTNAKIANNTIIGDSKIANSTITGNSGSSAMGVDSIHANRIMDDQFDASEFDRLTSGAVVATAHIIDGAVTETKITVNTVNTGHIQDGVITNAKIATGTIDASTRLATGSITANEMAPNSVGTSELIDSNVTTAKIADSNVTTAKIADANVTYGKLAGLPYVHAADTSQTALTTSNAVKISTNTPIAGRYIVTVSVSMAAVDSSTGDNGVALEAWMNDASGQVGPTMRAYVHTFTPAQNQQYILNFTHNIVQTASEPLTVTVKKSGGTGASQYMWSYLDAVWIAHS